MIQFLVIAGIIYVAGILFMILAYFYKPFNQVITDAIHVIHNDDLHEEKQEQ